MATQFMFAINKIDIKTFVKLYLNVQNKQLQILLYYSQYMLTQTGREVYK